MFYLLRFHCQVSNNNRGSATPLQEIIDTVEFSTGGLLQGVPVSGRLSPLIELGPVLYLTVTIQVSFLSIREHTSCRFPSQAPSIIHWVILWLPLSITSILGHRFMIPGLLN